MLRDHLDQHLLSSADRQIFGTFAQICAANGRARNCWQDAGFEPIALHTARHAYASFAITAGVNAKALSTYMGHANIGITLDLYGHLLPGNEDEAASLLDSYFDRSTVAHTVAHGEKIPVQSEIVCMYHIELRQFPHNFSRFNLSEKQLRGIVEPWSAGEMVELGERKWDPRRAKLTILEGPRIPNTQLTMGRGWSVAQRESEDVTRQVLAPMEDRGSSAEVATGASPSAGNVADSLALEVLSSLGDRPATLAEVWKLAAARSPRSSAGESLALAEQALRSLIRSRLILLIPPGGAPHDQGGSDDGLTPDRIEELLRAVDSWTGDGASAGVRIRRT